MELQPTPKSVINVTTDTFRAEVMERSMSVPVVADFWADWCAPCRQLMPLLEKLAEEYGGRFVLAKINVDESPEIAQAFGVQSIPAVFGILEGQPVAQLPGVQPEPQLRQWLDSFIPSPAVEAYNRGMQLEAAGDTTGAETAYREAVTADETAPVFQIALARTLLAVDRDVEAREIVETLEKRGFLEPEAQELKQQIEIRSHVEESGGTRTAREALAADPDNRTLQIVLAQALAVDKLYDEACDILLTIVQEDRSEARNAAKEAMVSVLGMMGPKSKAAGDYRRRLATAMY